jgi:hypothetical protein
VNEFVQECRREWKRLNVPDPIANEMAADLEADLTEAEAEGASPEEVLGSGAFDPRSFAASWAAERGVAQPAVATQSQPTPTPRATPRRKMRLFAALAGSAFVGLIFLVGATLVVGHFDSSRAVAAPAMRQVPIPPFPRMPVGPLHIHVASVHGPIGAIGLLFLLALIVGTIGLVLTVLVLRPWENADRWTRPHEDRDQTPEGHYS